MSLPGLCAGPELRGLVEEEVRCGIEDRHRHDGRDLRCDDGFGGDGRQEALGVGDAVEQAPWDGGIALCGAHGRGVGVGTVGEPDRIDDGVPEVVGVLLRGLQEEGVGAEEVGLAGTVVGLERTGEAVGVAGGVGGLRLGVRLVGVDVVGERQARAGGDRGDDLVDESVGADDEVEAALVVGVEHRVEVHHEVRVVVGGVAHLRVGLDAVERGRDVERRGGRVVVAVFEGALGGHGVGELEVEPP